MGIFLFVPGTALASLPKERHPAGTIVDASGAERSDWSCILKVAGP
jgi:hypothetical protein